MPWMDVEMAPRMRSKAVWRNHSDPPLPSGLRDLNHATRRKLPPVAKFPVSGMASLSKSSQAILTN